MSKCKDNYSIFIRPIHKRKPEVLEEHSPRVLRRGHPSKRESECASSGHFNVSKEPTNEPQLNVAVAGNFCKKLASRQETLNCRS